ncbi:glycosyl hydrolase [Streptomyces sp. NPDC090106]|uniref:glycosyl hydrolase n=1 Tax=Streptomyces sp. NPDC090106 TaxID=3365946 RepID=UPI0037FB8691
MATNPQDTSRRSVLAAGAAVAAAGAVGSVVPAGSAVAAPRAAGASTADGTFAVPEAAQRPAFRYWWPGGGVTPQQIAKEVGAMADAGFGSFEIADVRNSETAPMPVNAYAWGSPTWKAGVIAALRTAKARGLRADLTLGPYWPSVVPGLRPDDDAAMKELTYGQTVVDGGSRFDGAVPAPHSTPSGVKSGLPEVTVTPVLQAVHAARVVGSATASPVVLEDGTLTDVTGQVRNGRLAWTAPAGGRWVLIASWSRGTAMIERQAYYEGYFYSFTDPQAYVVDHFGAAGSQAVVNWWKRDLLTGEMRSLLRSVGGDFFEDSLEFLTELHWTPRMPQEFAARRGYALRSRLPLVHGQSSAVYVLQDAAVGKRVRWDYFQTLSDLYLDHHVGVLDDWARTLGMRLRIQPYGAPVDTGLAAARAGVPEGESLAFGSEPDSFRVLAAGRDLGRRGKVLSSEMGAVVNGAYRLSLGDLVTTANPGYALGVNQVRIHGFPYATSPSGQWPGFNPWAPIGAPINFAEAWGPRQPQWQHIDGTAGYLARVHKLLQSGTGKVDLAVYREEFDSAGEQFDGGALTDAGYSYQLVDWGLLGLPAARVRGGRLDADGAAYKALIVPERDTLLLDSARRVLAFARAGLLVVLVGELPSAGTSFTDVALQDKELAQVLGELARHGRTVRVSSPAGVPAALKRCSVTGSAVPDGFGGLLHVRRADGSGSRYFLLNTTAAAVKGTVSLEGTGRPYRVDPWTGQVTALAVYDSRERGRVSVPVEVGAGEAVVLAVSERQEYGCRTSELHAVSADTEVRHTSGGLVARATAAGTYTARLSDGRSASARVPAVPTALTLSSWRLDVEDWRPAHPGETGTAATATVRSEHSKSLAELVSWQRIDGLEDVSGVGVYTASFTLPAGYSSAAGAVLDLGALGAGSVEVRVNGKDLPPVNQVSPVVDLGDRLRVGSNTLTVTVATTLLNRLKATRPDAFVQPRQDYGLLGPVTVTPYAQAALRTTG